METLNKVFKSVSTGLNSQIALANELQNIEGDINHSALVNKIRQLEEIAARHCSCPRKPKCKVCFAREYIEALERMAGRGVAATK